MVAGFEDPTAGRISVSGKDMTGVRPYRRPVNTVFQSYALFPHLDVFENVAFGLREARVGKAEVRARVAEAISLVQLEGREHVAAAQALGWPAAAGGARPRARSTAPTCCSSTSRWAPST